MMQFCCDTEVVKKCLWLREVVKIEKDENGLQSAAKCKRTLMYLLMLIICYGDYLTSQLKTCGSVWIVY